MEENWCLVLNAAVCCIEHQYATLSSVTFGVMTYVAADMCRVYAGIHFLHDVTDGRVVGNQVSNKLPVHFDTCTLASNTTCVKYALAQRLA